MITVIIMYTHFYDRMRRFSRTQTVFNNFPLKRGGGVVKENDSSPFLSYWKYKGYNKLSVLLNHYIKDWRG